MIDIDGLMKRYSFSVRMGEFGEPIGVCKEFPSLSWIDGSREDALRGIKRLVRRSLEDMQRSGETPPSPSPSKD